MKTEPILNETESADFNEQWLNPPCTLTSEDFPESEYEGKDPEYYEEMYND